MPNFLNAPPVHSVFEPYHHDEGVYIPSTKLFRSLLKPNAIEKEIVKQLQVVVKASNDKEISSAGFSEAIEDLLALARIHRNMEQAAEGEDAKN